MYTLPVFELEFWEFSFHISSRTDLYTWDTHFFDTCSIELIKTKCQAKQARIMIFI